MRMATDRKSNLMYAAIETLSALVCALLVTAVILAAVEWALPPGPQEKAVIAQGVGR